MTFSPDIKDRETIKKEFLEGLRALLQKYDAVLLLTNLRILRYANAK